MKYSPDARKVLFPREEFSKNLNLSIYHFYVPMYLAHKLREAGFGSYFATIAPYTMTVSYEFITYHKSYKDGLKDPLVLRKDNKADRWKVGDLYTGLTGALIGAGHNSKVKFSKNKMLDLYNELTYTANRNIYKYLHPINQ
jgi:hypothetical protein